MNFDRTLLDDPVISGSLVSSMIIKLLSEFDESILEIHNSPARRGVESACKSAMSSLSRTGQRVLVMPEMLPGFSLLSFKMSCAKEGEAKTAMLERNAHEEAAAGELINAFSRETGNRLVVIRAKDVVIFLFPSEDMAKNLAEIGVK